MASLVEARSWIIVLDRVAILLVNVGDGMPVELVEASTMMQPRILNVGRLSPWHLPSCGITYEIGCITHLPRLKVDELCHLMALSLSIVWVELVLHHYFIICTAHRILVSEINCSTLSLLGHSFVPDPLLIHLVKIFDLLHLYCLRV